MRFLKSGALSNLPARNALHRMKCISSTIGQSLSGVGRLTGRFAEAAIAGSGQLRVKDFLRPMTHGAGFVSVPGALRFPTRRTI